MFIQNRYTITYHEPFGDAYFVGPERRFSRYEADRSASGFSDVTYKSAMDDIEAMCQLAAGQVSRLLSGFLILLLTVLKEKRLFIKDMAYFLVPSPGEKCGLACSFVNFPPEDQNPTLLPKQELEKFHFTFLIRHPRLSFASYYRLSSPAHKDKSKVSKFNPTDVGYTQLRCLFDYLKSEKLIGSHDPLQNGAKSKEPPVQICLVDAEDLLRQPEAIMKAYCKSTGISYDASMRQWGDLQDQEKAAKIINRWGFEAYFHRQVLDSTSLGLQVAVGDTESVALVA